MEETNKKGFVLKRINFQASGGWEKLSDCDRTEATHQLFEMGLVEDGGPLKATCFESQKLKEEEEDLFTLGFAFLFFGNSEKNVEGTNAFRLFPLPFSPQLSLSLSSAEPTMISLHFPF